MADTEKERQLRKLHQLAGNSIVNSMTNQFQDSINTGNLNPHTLLNPTAAVLNQTLTNHHHHHLTNNPVINQINPFLNSFAQYASYPSTAQQAYSQNEFDFSTNPSQLVNHHHHHLNPNVVPTLSHHSLINPTAAFLAGPLMTASLANNGLLKPVSSIAAASSGNYFTSS